MNSYEIEEVTRPKLLIPAGKCPVLLEDSSVESIAAWIKKIRNKFGSNFDCRPTVFRYWARKFCDGDPKKLQEIDDNITLVTNSPARLIDYMTGREK